MITTDENLLPWNSADDGLGSLGEVLLAGSCMCPVGLISCESFELKANSTELHFRSGTLKPGATKLFCGVLKYNTLINLSGRSIAPDAADFLATAIKINTTSEIRS